jgi:hypothetical protein
MGDTMSISRKAREAKRARAFDRKPGRKPGRVPLRKLDMRFEVAVFALLTRPGGRLQGQPHARMRAAKFAVCFSVDNAVTDYHRPGTSTEEQKRGISFTYKAGRGERVAKRNVAGRFKVTHDPELRDDARRTRVRWILRNAPRLIAGAKGADLVWLEVSMQALDGLLDAIALNDAHAMRYAVTVLQSPLIDWPVELTNSFLKVQSDQAFTPLLFHH